MREEGRQRFLLFDSTCSVCTQLALEVERETGGVMIARSLYEPEVHAWLDQARQGWRWEPTLLEVGGDCPQVFTGMEMGLRLVRTLGLRRAARVARLLQRASVPDARMQEQRRQFLRYSGSMFLTLLGSSILAACGGSIISPSPHPSATSPTSQAGSAFVGKVAGSAAFIGIISRGQTVGAYICDGTPERISISQWFQGRMSGNAVSLTAQNGARLQATLSAKGASGTFTSTTRDVFTLAALATPPVTRTDFNTAKPGLFRAQTTVNGVQHLQGWIFLSSGEVRGGSRNLSTNALSYAPTDNSCCRQCCTLEWP